MDKPLLLMKKISLLWISYLLFSSLYAQPTVNFWEDIPFEKIILPRGADVSIPASEYRTLRLDFTRATTLMHRAPTETEKKTNVALLLPLPDGTTEPFLIQESPVMEAGLAARYPQLKTYLARGLHRPELNGRIDLSPFGFHAAVKTPQGLFYIDPLSEGQTEYYVTYFTKNIQTPASFDIPRCGVSDKPLDFPKMTYDPTKTGQGGMLRSGLGQTVNLQTYRLALACTGEYGQAKGGNKTAVLATMVTAINRVNQVFESETAIRLVLINQNDTLIYLDGTTDPYSAPDNATTLLGQNTTVLNQILGAGSYDLGHVFTLGCKNGIGGIANYASACGPNKGAGVTCHFTTNTAYIAVQVMAHELGHQFACGHSWNSCADYASQLDLDDAFEPGSGSTIMSYANACGADNIQNSSDDYYHVGSLEDFYAFSRQYQGKNCATVVPTENNLPELKLTYPSGFYIPINTPFELTANATDADGDPLTYCWEQYDIGPSVPLGEAQLNSPLFRSLRPTTSPTRTFPRISTLLNNSRDIREVLPKYARKMTFRCTVRDNHPGAAGVVWAQVQFQTSDAAGPFVVTSPNTAEVLWTSGSVQTVTWDVAQTDKAPVNCRYVNIRLSTDGGFTYPYILAEKALNTGTAQIAVPTITTDGARIRVEAADNIFFDLSNQTFKITPATQAGYSISVQPYTIPLHCQPQPLEFIVNTQKILNFDSLINLTLATPLPPGSTYQFVPNPVQAGKSSTLTITPAGILHDTLEVAIRANAQNGPSQEQFVRFTTLSNSFDSLRTVFPQNGTSGILLSTPLSWTSVPNAQSYNLELATSPAFGSTTVFSKQQITATTWQPNVILDNNKLYYWRIQPNNACGASPFLDPSTFHTATTSCKTYESTNVPLNIPGAGTPVIESRVTIPESGTLNDVNIPLLRINKEYVRNLRLSLISPKGTEVILYNGHCALTSKLYLGFDDDAPQAVNGAGVCPPDDGIVFRPTEALSRFKGENIQGTWTLRIAIIRNESLSPGALESWKLEFCSTFAPTQPRLVQNDTLLVPPGKNNTLTPSQLLAEDGTAGSQQLLYTVVRPPAYGQLKVQGTALTAGSTFTQADINTFQLQYLHGGSTVKTDQFTFVVQNGKGGFIAPTPFNIRMDANAVVDVDAPVPTALGFSIFPNPASDNIQLVWAAPITQDAFLRVFGIQGQVLFQQVLRAGNVQQDIPVSGFPAGMYLIQVQTPQGVLQQTLAVQR